MTVGADAFVEALRTHARRARLPQMTKAPASAGAFVLDHRDQWIMVNPRMPNAIAPRTAAFPLENVPYCERFQ